MPQFEFDPTWPKQPFPNDEIIGNVIGLAIDANEHIWALHRPQTITEQERGAAFAVSDALCCRPVKPVIEIDQAVATIGSISEVRRQHKPPFSDPSPKARTKPPRHGAQTY